MPTHDEHTRHIAAVHEVIEQIARFRQNEATGLYTFTDYDHEVQGRRIDTACGLIARINEHLAAVDSPLRWDLDEQVDRWLAAHPLALTGAIMKAVIDRGTNEGNGEQVAIQIGTPGEGGRYYHLHAHQFERDPRTGMLRVVLPDAVAEEFRQAGRRALQREFAHLMAVEQAG